MIQIESIRIEEFRGIRRLTLDLSRSNYAICGRNGTGKSGVVDAIEFALTGSVSRLTGRGTGAVSAKSHGPHVDVRDHPEKARVVLKAFVPQLGRSVTIERRLNKPSIATVTPDDAEVRGVVTELGTHPEFALSRREILKYVTAEPGERSKEVQALLKLESINRIRSSLQTIANSCKSESAHADSELTAARANLMRVLDIEELRSEAILKAANERRRTLGLAELTELTKDMSLKAGVAESVTSDKARTLSKDLAAKELGSVLEILESPEPAEVAEARSNIGRICSDLLATESLLANLKRRAFIQTGFDLIDEAICPLCDTAWDIEALRGHLRSKLAEAVEASKLQQSLELSAALLRSRMLDVTGLLRSSATHAAKLSPPLEVPSLASAADQLLASADRLTSLDHLTDTRAVVSGPQPSWLQATIPVLKEVLSRILASPDLPTEHQAREFLIVGQERLEIYKQARRQFELKKRHEARAAATARVYTATSNRVLSGIYSQVAADFSRFYRFINREDEERFTGRLIPSLGKLGFEVDFYGRGFFPPGAYHSEGHQDGMGLCLYLALMKHTLGERFTFAVLDDVLMSIDTGHRKEVCRLLKGEFPATQFIITTHDSIWLRHLQTEQVITRASVAHFRKWTVDDGPALWDEKEIWDEIRAELDNGRVPEAAGALRRFLEFITDELAGRLRLNLEYRSSGEYELGDLLPAVISGWSELLGKAKAAAEAWKNKEELDRLRVLHEEFKRRVIRSQVEQWAMNKSVHYNSWATLEKEDFLPVVEAFHDLVEAFKCPVCLGILYVTPPRGNREGIRCDCNKTTINLKKPD